MTPREPHPVDRLPRTVDAWCRDHLSARPVEVIFAAESMSRVFGLRLDDDRLVAVKLRPAEARVFACADAQRSASAAGIDCPRLLAGPSTLDTGATELATAEEWRADGATRPTGTPQKLYAALAHRLVAALARLDPGRFAPPPPWLHYDHGSPSRTWAPTRSTVWDPQRPDSPVPGELLEFADRARRRLLAAELPDVVGHSDLNGLNVHWVNGSDPVVHDWDSLAARPEAVLVGCVAANHVEIPQRGRIADVPRTEELIRAYQALRGTPFTAEEVEVAWAAGVWVACYNAAFEYLHGGPGAVAVRILADAPHRLRRAGG